MITCHRKIARIAILPDGNIGRVKDTETSILCGHESGITFISCGGRRDYATVPLANQAILLYSYLLVPLLRSSSPHPSGSDN